MNVVGFSFEFVETLVEARVVLPLLPRALDGDEAGSFVLSPLKKIN